MKNIKFLVLSLLGMGLSFSSPKALEIPLTGAAGASANGGAKIAYVDMELIFQLYPQTRFVKEDYAKQLQKKREQLAEKDAELANIKSRIAVLESTLKGMGLNNAGEPAVSTPTAANGLSGEQPGSEQAVGGDGEPQAVLSMKKELEEKQAEYEDLRQRAFEELAAFERQQTQTILGKIYLALRDLAQEEQVTLVVDKSSILYGAANIDLTEKLQQRVRGY